MTDKETLIYIKETYVAAILAAVRVWGGRPEVIAGIMMRETLGGLSPLLSPHGPAGTGDNGHGHGLMQIDDRSFPNFTDSEEWKVPELNIKFGAYVLKCKTDFFIMKKDFIGRWDTERLGIAAYNGGEGRVFRAIREGDNPDQVTTGSNYSRKVLEYAAIYEQLGPSTEIIEPSMFVPAAETFFIPAPPPIIPDTPLSFFAETPALPDPPERFFSSAPPTPTVVVSKKKKKS